MVKFDGLDITPRDLKRLIMFREKLKPWLCDLKISNAQTNQEYTDDDTHIPRNTSVIIRRVPVWGVKPPRKNVRGSQSAAQGPNVALKDLLVAQTVNLAEANASEEEKIKAMMSQSTHQYDPLYYVENPEETPPPGYTCFRCGKKGHYIKNCPTNGVDFKPLPREKKSTGIPRSFMVEVDDPTMQGAMLTNTGSYAIPTIAAEAYAIGKKERPPFLPQEPTVLPVEDDWEPDELLCQLCEELMMDAAVIPCCGRSYCDDCIRTCLLDSNHECPTCHQSGVSPDSLTANKLIRQV
ncbi:RBBP6 ligase, partial [Amia calva]|nr:RBBP6 ligase [Amia calva]